MKRWLKRFVIHLTIVVLTMQTAIGVMLIKPLGARASGPTTIASWNFPNNPDDAIIDAGTVANSGKTIQAIGTWAPTFAAGDPTMNFARADHWDSGADLKYWLIGINTAGYQNIKVSSIQKSSPTGPKDFKLQTSIDGSVWNDVSGGTITLASDFTTGVVSNLALPSESDNQASLQIRWIMTSNISVSLGVVGTAGASNIDDILVTGEDLDSTVPTIGTVYNGKVVGVDSKWTSVTDKISANWSGFEDLESGIKKYQYAVGSTSGGIEILTWTDTTDVYFTDIPVTLEDAATYYVSVKAINNVDLVSDVVTSDGVTVDLSKPDNTNAIVSDGGDVTNNAGSIIASWDGFEDPQSAISSYKYAVGTTGTTTGVNDILDWTATTETDINYTLVTPLLDGDKYFVSVIAINGAGLESDVVTSDGITIDLTAPDPATNVKVIDHPNDDGGFIDVTWDKSVSTDVVSYEVGYGTTNVDSLAVFEDAGDEEAKTIEVPDNNTAYYIFVRALDQAGNISTSAMAPQTVTAKENLLPGAPKITEIVLTCDGDCSADISYKVSGDTDYIEMLVTLDEAMTHVVQKVKQTNLTGKITINGLEAGTKYFFSIIAHDKDGNVSQMMPMPATPLKDSIVVVIPGLGGDPGNPRVSISEEDTSYAEPEIINEEVTINEPTSYWIPTAHAVTPTKPKTDKPKVTPTPTGQTKSDTDKKEEKEGPARTVVLIILLIGAAIAIYYVFKGAPREDVKKTTKTTEDKSKDK